MAYSLESLRRARDPQTAAAAAAAAAPHDAPHATDDTIGYWNGEAFVSWADYVWWQVKKNLNSENTWANSDPRDTTITEQRSKRKTPTKQNKEQPRNGNNDGDLLVRLDS